MKTPSLSQTLLLIAALVFSTAAEAQTYDARKDFSITQNPNGVWSYGSTDAPASNAFRLSPQADTANTCGAPVEYWHPASGTAPDVGRTAGFACGEERAPAELLHLHPSSSGQRAVLRWTAPAAGTYLVNGVFQAINYGASTDVKISKNETEPPLFSGRVDGYQQQPFNFTVTVAVGDTIDFSVGYGTNLSWISDATGLAVTIGQPVTACETAPANLQVSVPAENSPSDVQSGNKNASLVGNATYTNGKVGRAFSFDGDGDYVRIEDNAAQRPANAVTVEGWFKFNSLSGIQVLVSKPRGCVGCPATFENSYALYFVHGALHGVTATRIIGSPFSPQTGVWYHLAYVFDDAANTHSLFVNGVSVASDVNNEKLAYDANPYPLLIGADIDHNAPQLFQNGQADEVSIYGRALTQAELFDIARQGSFGKCKEIDVDGLWAAGRDLLANEKPDNGAESNATNAKIPEWSYGYRSAAASTALTLFTPQQHVNDPSGLEGWIAPGQATLGVNTKTTPIVYDSGSGNYKPLLPEQIYLSPGSGNEFLVARWTAPAAGDYRVLASWLDLDKHGGNGARAFLFKNGQEQFAETFQSTATSTGRARLRARTLTLNAGDVLDFVLGGNGDSSFDGTSFNAAIRRIPKVTITSPASGIQLTGAQDVTFNVDVAHTESIQDVFLKVNEFTSGPSDFTAPYSLKTHLKPGYHRISVVATDLDGAKAESPEVIVIVAPAPAQQSNATKSPTEAVAAAVNPPSKLLYSSASGSWHDPATWGNAGVPGRWDHAIIQPGHVVVMEFGIQVRHVTVNGTLGRAGAASAQPALDVYGTLHATGQIENLDLYINGPAGKFLILGKSPVLRSVNIINQSKFVITADGFAGEGVTIENRGSIKAGPPQVSQERLRVSLTGLSHTAGKLTIDPNTVVSVPPGVKLGGLVELSPGHVVSDAGAGLISDNGAVLIGLDGGTLIGLDGGTLIGLDGGTLIGLDGGTLVGPDGAPLIGLDGGTLIGNAGGTIQPTRTDMATNAPTAPTAGDIMLTGGNVTGIGEIRGHVVNQGAFVVPGNSAGGIVVNGSFTQEPGGTLVLELGGKTTNPFTYDIFQVAGTANLGGNLVVKTINGYTPASGDTVSALLYGNHTGNFASISSNAQVSLGAKGAQVTTNGTNPQGPRALNISTRLQIQSGDNALFAGFIVTGPAGSTKKVLIRGIGPSLAQFGVTGTIPDPLLELHGSGTPITNDDWQQAPNANEIPNGFAPGNSKESIIIATLTPGNYSAILKGAHGETGIGLAEVYDLEPNSGAQLANIATRGLVQTGDNVLIGGFIIAGNQPAKVLVRAIGPSLTAFGLQGALQDTTLELHDSNGGAISNDNWAETDASAILGTTIPPSHPNEAAVLAVLAPGNYTAVVRGADDTTGIAVVEAYNLQ